MAKRARKTMKEIRLQEYVTGFYDCLYMFEEAFRDYAHKEYCLRRATGRSTLVKDSTCPKVAVLWEVIEKAQKRIHPIDSEYKELALNR